MSSRRKGGISFNAQVRKKAKKTLKTLTGVLVTSHLETMLVELPRNVGASAVVSEVKSKTILKAHRLTEKAQELQLSSIQTFRRFLTKSWWPNRLRVREYRLNRGLLTSPVAAATQTLLSLRQCCRPTPPIWPWTTTTKTIRWDRIATTVMQTCRRALGTLRQDPNNDDNYSKILQHSEILNEKYLW